MIQDLKDMIRWEQTENYLVSNKDKYDELRLSMSNVILDTSAGISVRINNNYSV